MLALGWRRMSAGGDGEEPGDTEGSAQGQSARKQTPQSPSHTARGCVLPD